MVGGAFALHLHEQRQAREVLTIPCWERHQALETLAGETGGARWVDALSRLSQAREQVVLPPGTGAATTLGLIDLAQALRERAEQLS